MNTPKLLVGIAAQNLAGKTDLAIGLIKKGIKHFSVREYIGFRHIEEHGVPVGSERKNFTQYCEKTKMKLGPETFIKDATKSFYKMEQSFAIVESIRSPGEGLWLNHGLQKEFPDMQGILINLIAPEKDRLRRFFEREKEKQLATLVTEEEFYLQELQVNSGNELWSENIDRTMKYGACTFNNPDGKFEEVMEKIYNFIATYKAPVQSTQTPI